jgi:hypothetical protein
MVPRKNQVRILEGPIRPRTAKVSCPAIVVLVVGIASSNNFPTESINAAGVGKLQNIPLGNRFFGGHLEILAATFF